jgi:hypothetical protein
VQLDTMMLEEVTWRPGQARMAGQAVVNSVRTQLMSAGRIRDCIWGFELVDDPYRVS